MISSSLAKPDEFTSAATDKLSDAPRTGPENIDVGVGTTTDGRTEALEAAELNPADAPKTTAGGADVVGDPTAMGFDGGVLGAMSALMS